MQRPFYLIAHHINLISQIQQAINLGANAIECDIDVHDGALVVRHPAPDILSPAGIPTVEAFVPYLQEVARVASRDTRLSLVIFDCKLSDASFATAFMEEINRHINRVVNLNILVSIGDFSQQAFLDACMAIPVGPRQGFGIDAENDFERVQNFFNSNGISNTAYGNGIFAGSPNVFAPNVAFSVQECVAEKALNNGIRFVYVWTLGRKSTLRHYLRAGVDGIFVNLGKIVKLVNILNEAEFSDAVRMATNLDNPFAPSRLPSYVLTTVNSNRRHAGTDALLTFTLFGTNGVVSRNFDSKLPKLFEKGDVNRVTLIGEDVGAINCLSVSRNSGGNAPGWFLRNVSIQSESAAIPPSPLLIYDSWIPRSGLRRCFGVARYRLVVFTSNRNFAGTDALVTFSITGALGSVSHQVASEGYRFERGTSHVINFQGQDVGAISFVSVSHDGSGRGPDWYLNRIELTAPSGEFYNIIFNRDIEEGDIAAVPV